MNLTVKAIEKKDAGNGLAAIDKEAMEELNVSNGNYIKVKHGNNSIILRVFPGYPRDEGEKVLRIDAEARSALGISRETDVQVEKTEVKVADSVSFAFPEEMRVQGDIAQTLKNEFSESVIKEGQLVPLPQIFHSRQNGPKILVSNTEPSGNVLIDSSTSISIDDKSIQEISEGDVSSSELTTNISYEDIGGLDSELDRVREVIEIPMQHPQLFERLGIEPPKGVLLHGPPGTGKTLIAKAVANEIDASFHNISGPEIMSKFYGESEGQLRDIFDEAGEESPAIIFIDEIDSIAPKRGEASGDVERRIVAQLLAEMDGLEERDNVIVIGATNRPDSIDPALRRGGRFDREIEIGVPSEEGRKEILHIHTRDMPLDGVDLDSIAEKTHGFVGADIEAMTKEAAMTALRRIRPEIDLDSDTIDGDVLNSLSITSDDFETAFSEISPSALREVFVETPDISWNDVGGLKKTKKNLKEIVQWPLQHEDVFDDMDLNTSKGILLYGPPGTGKTLLAKAVANEADTNFISVKGPELLNKYVGESEKGVREIFEKARENAPAVIFFDEIDAIAGSRGQNSGDSGVGERVVSQLLTELDGLEQLDDVVVIATSNRPELIDSALLRPGRFSENIHVPPPDSKAREDILRVHTEEKPLSENVNLELIAQKTDGFVGADIEALVKEATMNATRDILDSEKPDEVERKITGEHFTDALDNISSSVTDDMVERYQEIEEKFESSRPQTETNRSRTFH